jgi:hypothetical protein
MVNPRQVLRAIVFALLLSVFPATLAFPAYGQSFTLSVVTPLSPVNPGGVSVATLDLEGTSGSVSFTTTPCTVTPVQTTGTPTCLVSPDSATPPAQPSVTVTTTSITPAGSYAVTVTGTSGSTSQSVNLNLGVVPVSGNYILSASPTTATPNPVTAGNTATTTVTVTPVATYTGTITLSCLSITPPTTPSPVCLFDPETVTLTADAVPPTSILNITTTNPNTPTTQLRNRRIFYALWLGIPGLLLAGVGATGRAKKRLLGMVLLTVAASSLLLLPSCNSTNINNHGVTPSNTYTVTLTGADENGNAPSTTTPTTVMVVVN